MCIRTLKKIYVYSLLLLTSWKCKHMRGSGEHAGAMHVIEYRRYSSESFSCLPIYTLGTERHRWMLCSLFSIQLQETAQRDRIIGADAVYLICRVAQTYCNSSSEKFLCIKWWVVCTVICSKRIIWSGCFSLYTVAFAGYWNNYLELSQLFIFIKCRITFFVGWFLKGLV